MWTVRCRFNWLWYINLFGHERHLIWIAFSSDSSFISPACLANTWYCKPSFWTNFLSQYTQANGFLSVCTNLCRHRNVLCMDDFPQSSQVYLFTFWSVSSGTSVNPIESCCFGTTWSVLSWFLPYTGWSGSKTDEIGNVYKTKLTGNLNNIKWLWKCNTHQLAHTRWNGRLIVLLKAKKLWRYSIKWRCSAFYKILPSFNFKDRWLE